MLPSPTLCSVVVRGVPGQGVAPVSSQCQHLFPMKIARTKPVMVPEAVPEIDVETMAQRLPTKRQTTRRPASVGVIVYVTHMKASARFRRGQKIVHANVITVALVASDAQT